MDLLKTIGSVAGSVVGSAVLPGIGTALGSAIGGAAGDVAKKGLESVFAEFAKDPVKSLTNPNSLVSRFVDTSLRQLGAPKEFRTLTKFALDPRSAIEHVLSHGMGKCNRPINTSGCHAPTPGLRSNDCNDTVDTGRYLISAKEGELKIYDKETNTWVKAWGDPHLHTSDGDKAQFHKDSVTIDLEDGTKVTIQPTPPDKNGVALIDRVAITKGSEGVVMTGFSDGKAGVNTSAVSNNGWLIDAMHRDGTVLRAGHQVDDLTFASNGREIVGTDPTQRWGEHMLDGMAGTSRNNARLPWHFSPLPMPRPLPPMQPGIPTFPKLPVPPGLDLGRIRDILDRCPRDPSTPLVDGLKGIIEQAQKLLEGATGNAGKGGVNVKDMIREDAVRGQTPEQVGEEASVPKGGDIYSRLFAVLAKLQKQMENKLGQIEKHAASMDSKGDKAGVQDKATLDRLQFELQQVQNMMNQITTTATNLLKSEHDTRMSVIRNLA